MRIVAGRLGAGRIIATLRILPLRESITLKKCLYPMRQEPGRVSIDSKDTVKKTFKINIEGKNRDRVLEAVKHEIRQYMKRERNKALPEGVDFWDFDCRFGLSQDAAAGVHVATITALIDAAAQEGADAFYLELLAKPGIRQTRPSTDQTESAD